MPYPINQRAHQFNSIQSVPVSFGLWDTALKFLSPGPRNEVTDHLVLQKNSYFPVICVHKKFLSCLYTHILYFEKILNLELTFAVCGERDSKFTVFAPFLNRFNNLANYRRRSQTISGSTVLNPR